MDNLDNKTLDFLSDAYANAYPETKPFWEAAEKDELLLKTCHDCGKPHWYPRMVCPLCGSANTAWLNASGQGSLYAFSHIEKANPPYTLAYVQLNEGPIIMSNIIDADINQLKIGSLVTVAFQRMKEGRKMPVFRLSE
ncbi:OB-fold domain-containing protein [Advenella sp. WQ 585]|uniref:OB-fold domain-containing protein n=1 Tax=Advenella mandrilli TaxID=2800330 RepID=A0ABS1EDJ2_9BURK|nr:OB-fold domain-containing protein [Advenella mandrilli]MBK1781093.1 OB-fold domain-containing protein [Advenella mandrilli]